MTTEDRGRFEIEDNGRKWARVAMVACHEVQHKIGNLRAGRQSGMALRQLERQHLMAKALGKAGRRANGIPAPRRARHEGGLGQRFADVVSDFGALPENELETLI